MTRIPIISGVFADTTPDFRTSYPVNLVPVPKMQGVSEGYLRTARGLLSEGTGPGIARGGIRWDGVLYRVMGTKLVSIDSAGTVTTLGDVGGTTPVSMTYSFDRLAIASAGNLYYWDKSTLTQVTDPDLGTALDVVWVDGYFMTTDGEFLVVTELADPTAVDPLKYGSSEVDPDPILAVKKVRNEIHAINRYTIEMFSNTGGTGFPFSVIRGAQVQKGAVGTHMCAVLGDTIAFVGGGRDEAISVYLGTNGASQKIGTREIDMILEGYSEADLSTYTAEVVEDRGHRTFMIHLSDRTLCYDVNASAVLGQPVWYFLASGLQADSQYRGRYFVWCYDKWNAADSASTTVGKWDDGQGEHWGDPSRWEFGTPIVYNEGNAAQIHRLELAGLVGAVSLGENAFFSLEWSSDGVTWSQPRYIMQGVGRRDQRITWNRQGMMRQRRMYRFRGDVKTPVAMAAVVAEIEGLAW